MAIETWEYKDKHVPGSDIDSEGFLSSSKCIVYAQYLDSKDSQFTSFYPIGLIQGYTWGEQRQIEQILELGSDIPYLVPGRTSGQISLNRMLVAGKDLSNVLYGRDGSANKPHIKSLKDIEKPINLLFATYSSKVATVGGSKMAYSRLFQSCWIVSRNESVGAGQAVIAESCNILYERIGSVKF